MTLDTRNFDQDIPVLILLNSELHICMMLDRGGGLEVACLPHNLSCNKKR